MIDPRVSQVLISLIDATQNTLDATRILLDEMFVENQTVDGKCSHPVSKITIVETFGGKVPLCNLCGNFLEGEQSVEC